MNVETIREFMDFWEMIIMPYNIFCISTWFFKFKKVLFCTPPKLGNGFHIVVQLEVFFLWLPSVCVLLIKIKNLIRNRKLSHWWKKIKREGSQSSTFITFFIGYSQVSDSDGEFGRGKIAIKWKITLTNQMQLWTSLERKTAYDEVLYKL